MQAVGTIAHALAGPVYHKPDREESPIRNKQKKTDYGAFGRHNAFLKTKFPPVAPAVVTRQWEGKECNYITGDNYSYLLESAKNYASLMGVELKHNPGGSIGEGISNIYDELDGITGEINLNIETCEDRLQFILWKYHPWGNYTFYWLPVRFTESLNPGLRKIALSFIHGFMHSNGMVTTNNAFDVEWVLEWAREDLDRCDPPDRESSLKLIESYQSGRIYRLMERINNKCYYKNLPAALRRYIPGNEFERRLIKLFTEGLRFIGRDKPSIMSYGYDPLDDEDRDYHPVDMERMIRIVYDNDDFVTEWMMDWANQELRESYDISPATYFPISPCTTELFSMDEYPDHFFKWFDKLCTLIS